MGCAVLALPSTAAAVGQRPSSPTAAKPFLNSRTATRERAAKAGKTVAAARPSEGPTRHAARCSAAWAGSKLTSTR